MVVPVERTSCATADAAGAEVAAPATRSLNWLDRAKPRTAGDAITVEIAADMSLAEVSCGAKVGPVLAGCCWFTPPTLWPASGILVVPIADRGFVIVVGCVDVMVVIAEGVGSF